jgi:chromate reductase, NAD(P)H dehydrogenase (quinone)
MLILGISGSLRRESTNTHLISAASDCAPSGSRFIIASQLAELPHFNPDIDPEDIESVDQWVGQVRIADGIVVSTPEYARGYPGTLKNALDWLVQTDAHIEKPFMLLNASKRSVVAQRTLTTVMETMSGIHIHEATTTIPLLGKTISRTDILADKGYRRQIEDSLTHFANEIVKLKLESDSKFI